MKKSPLLILGLFALFSCTSRSFASTDALPPPPPPPAFVLSGLDKAFPLFKPADAECLQRAVNRISNSKADPRLVEHVFAAADAYGLDRIIFLGMVFQETGTFVPARGKNGTGVTQMTGVAIKDACHAMEGTRCRAVQANPEYREIWTRKMNDALGELYDTNSPDGFYPWRRFCAKPESRCNSTCGITPDCMGSIKTEMMDDDRVSINLGGLTLLNTMGVVQKERPNASMETKYRAALKMYNGHPVHSKLYAQRIFGRIETLKKSCEIKRLDSKAAVVSKMPSLGDETSEHKERAPITENQPNANRQ